MTSPQHTTAAERMGRWLGRGWRRYLHGERTMLQALAAKGVPLGVAVTVMWGVKLLVLGLLWSVAFWAVLLGVFLVAAAAISAEMQRSDDSEYVFDECIKPHKSPAYDPNFYNDITDVNYRDD
ncbi:DUF3742 family protein [Delftia lacustris]|uniref:DUF3742 family protein n=1 Tax=Delftia lacustris TaxID=558537 RepID=UPI00193C37D0|nr:DUF3742 family protein [Delftia lacustris]QRI92992.1 DUF3742 family protein [Delftia lacustris]